MSISTSGSGAFSGSCGSMSALLANSAGGPPLRRCVQAPSPTHRVLRPAQLVDPSSCLVSEAALTLLASARQQQAWHPDSACGCGEGVVRGRRGGARTASGGGGALPAAGRAAGGRSDGGSAPGGSSLRGARAGPRATRARVSLPPLAALTPARCPAMPRRLGVHAQAEEVDTTVTAK